MSSRVGHQQESSSSSPAFAVSCVSMILLDDEEEDETDKAGTNLTASTTISSLSSEESCSYCGSDEPVVVVVSAETDKSDGEDEDDPPSMVQPDPSALAAETLRDGNQQHLDQHQPQQQPSLTVHQDSANQLPQTEPPPEHPVSGNTITSEVLTELVNVDEYDDEQQSLQDTPIPTFPGMDVDSGAGSDRDLDLEQSSSDSAVDKQRDDNNDALGGESGHKGVACSRKWSAAIYMVKACICRILHWFTQAAAMHPKTTLAVVPMLSIALLLAGWFTKFNLVTNNGLLWPPTTTLSRTQSEWYYYNSTFNYDPETMEFILHRNGDNVLSMEGVRRVFQVQNTIAQMKDYQMGCQLAELIGKKYQVGTCRIHSVAHFWNNSMDVFQAQVTSDAEAVRAMSAPTYPNGVGVDMDEILGDPQPINNDNANGEVDVLLESAQSLVVQFDIPRSNVTTAFIMTAIQVMLDMQAAWEREPDNSFRLEIYSVSAYGEEFQRAIVNDLPLLPAVFVVMSVFTCLVFAKRDKVQSRAMLGFGAVVCVLLSITTGYGLLFICGVPFTTCTTMLPFLMFGIGLDDAFILIGSYSRTDPHLDPAERIRITIDDVGLSIFLTSLTSALAFLTGVFSQIPAVSWLCLYAFPTIVIDFVYQITFFIALMVIDERRIHANRRDVCCCITVVGTSSDSGEECTTEDTDNQETAVVVRPSQAHVADQIMRKYARLVLIPWFQNIVILLFIALFGWSVYSTINLKQKFNYVDMVPSDSYLRGYFVAKENYASTRNGLEANAYFRFVDQSNPDVQDQMEQYVNDLVKFGPVEEPLYFWLRDFRLFVQDSANTTFDGGNITLADMTFDEQVKAFLSVPIWDEIYSEMIGITKQGKVRESRCAIYIQVDMTDSKACIDTLYELRSISAAQPINQGVDGGAWPFFTYQVDYHLWEFYSRVVSELTSNTIVTIITVNLVAVVFIPHWTAVLFVFPFISFLYLDMLGFLHLSGVEVNAISYITLVLSIGLMVDFIIHILLRYYESSGTRQERVKETLETMGSSILLGAVSTFLGVLLLVFSTSVIIQNIFVSFIGLCTFGVLHGVLFLPVLLAIIGPQ